MTDELISTLPVRFSNKLSDKVHIHQYPLLSRRLQAPPSAVQSGRDITARIKPTARRLEVHVPADTRHDVWNNERGRDFGSAQLEYDKEKNQVKKGSDETELAEIRLRSEEIGQKGTHMLGVVRNNELHLHPISQTHQFRPTLTYLDHLSRKTKRFRSGQGSDSDSDDGPPPDPDEPPPAPAPKKEKKKGEAREVQVSTRKADDKSGPQSAQAGLSAARREILQTIRLEEDENWQNLNYRDVDAEESEAVFEGLLSKSPETLACNTSQSDAFLTFK